MNQVAYNMPRRNLKYSNLKKLALLFNALRINKLFILLGINENTISLADSIRKAGKGEASEDGGKAKERIEIVFVVMSPKDDLQKAKSLGVRICKSAANLPKRHKAKSISIFCISDDEDENLDKATKMLNLFGKDKKVSVYCRVNRRNEKSHQLELLDARNVSEIVKYNKWNDEKKDEEALECTRFRVVYSLQIATEHLFCDEANLPINYVEIDSETASVRFDFVFKSMIIGFGEVGQAVFYHLYTLGAFVDSKGNKIPARKWSYSI